MAPSGDLGTDHDRYTQHIERNVVCQSPRDPSGHSETSHKQRPRRVISELIMIAASIRALQKRTVLPKPLSLYQTIPELMNAFAWVWPYLKPFLESV